MSFSFDIEMLVAAGAMAACVAAAVAFRGERVRRKDAEARLEEMKSYLNALDLAGVVLVNQEHRKEMIHFSNAWKRMLGYADTEIDNWQTMDDWLGRMHPEELETFLARVRENLARDTPTEDLQHRVLCKDGSWKWVLGRIVRQSDRDGSGVHGVGVLSDITYMKELEARLKALNETLQEKVEAETSRRLEHERILARQARLASMGSMLGVIAHQWRQPLSTLDLVFQSLRKAWDSKLLDSEFMEKAEDDARRQISFMSDTIDTFRNYIRPDKGKEPFLLARVLSEAVGMSRSRFASKGVAIKTDMGGAEGVRVSGFAREFKQAILNLLSNACDAAAERGGGSGQVDVRGKQAEGRVSVSVWDNGTGIPPELQGRIFEPYFSTKDDSQGTGLGLYIARMIVVDGMGGNISFESSTTGTVFKIELEVAQ